MIRTDVIISHPSSNHGNMSMRAREDEQCGQQCHMRLNISVSIYKGMTESIAYRKYETRLTGSIYTAIFQTSWSETLFIVILLPGLKKL